MLTTTTLLDDIDGRTFDFVIVGGGTSGCLIAAHLAKSLTYCRVLVLEAGGDTQEDDLIPGLCKPRFGNADGNWMYQTMPQNDLNGRVIPYPRGRGMGGCSGNNFMAWVRGPRVDYDDWAEMTGDPWWRWDNVLEEMKKLEDFDQSIPPGHSHHAFPTPGAHGKGGPFTVTYNTEWQPIIEHCMRAGQEAGHKVNLDNNDGDEEGISIAQFNVNNGTRVTSSTAYLETSVKDMKNLTVVTNALVSKLLIENKQVKGVEILHANTPEGQEKVVVWAMKEVILTAGCFQSPQLLLLSGIGPVEDLGTLDIPTIANLPVGQNLQDHSALACEFIIDPTILGHNQLLNDPKGLKEATERYAQTKDGPLAMFGASAAIIFPKLQQLHRTKEFKALDNVTRKFLEAKDRPSTEIWMHSGPLFYTGPCPPDASVLVIEGLCQNNLSRGSLKLASSDPRELPKIDPRYLSHPYDIQIAIETIRSIIQLARTPTFSSIIQSVLLGPRSPADEKTLAADSGEDDGVIEVFVRETLTQGFHSMSTCTMGKDENKNKVVDKKFKVVGVEGLRVADMSVCPILTCNHTQVNAYLIGQRCAELLVEEWGGVKRRGTKL